MTKVKVYKAGVTLEVEAIAVDYYLRTGYKVRKEKAVKPTPPPAAPIKAQLVEPEPVEQPAPPTKKSRKPRKKKADK